MGLSRRGLVAAAFAIAGTAGATVVSLTSGMPAGAASGCVTPADYIHSIPGPIGGPAAAATLGSSISYATIGGDRKVYVVSTGIDEPDLAVGPLECEGGGAVDTPAVTDYDDGKALFVLAPNGRVYQNYSPNGDFPATPWTVVPGAPAGGGAPAVSRRRLNGPIELFVRGGNGHLYHLTRDSGGAGTWYEPEDLGGSMTGIATAGTIPGVEGTVVVVRAPNGALYQRTGNLGSWTPWMKLAGTTSASPALATGFADGRLDLFVTGTTGGLYQSTWIVGGRWSTFRRVDLDLPRGAKLAATGKNSRMIVYATATDSGGTTVGYDHYIPGLGWSGFDLAPYTCATCLPDVAPGAVTGTLGADGRHPMR